METITLVMKISRSIEITVHVSYTFMFMASGYFLWSSCFNAIDLSNVEMTPAGSGVLRRVPLEPGTGEELESRLALFPGKKKSALMIRMTGSSPGQITTKIWASAASQPRPGLHHWLCRPAHWALNTVCD